MKRRLVRKELVGAVLLTAAALLATFYRFLPYGNSAAAHLSLLFWLVGLLFFRGRMWLATLGIAGVNLVSAAVNGIPAVELVNAGCALTGLPLAAEALYPFRYRILAYATVGSFLLSLHAMASFATFRMVGGGPGVRPTIWYTGPFSVGVALLAWPYYCGHYPWGDHAIGLLLNDNALGVWCAAFFGLAVGIREETPPGPFRRILSCSLVCFVASVAWSYSRSGALALGGVLLYLAGKRRGAGLALLAIGLVVALHLGFAGPRDQERFVWPGHAAAGAGGRLELVRAAVNRLASGSLLGGGPNSFGLVDSQFCKIALELGWLGLFAWSGWLAVVFLRARSARLPCDRGLKAGILALLIASVGSDLLDWPHLAACLYLFVGLLGSK